MDGSKRREVIEVQRRYPIKEFSELTGVPQQTVRNWEEVFGEGFPVDRDPQNQRYYTDYHVSLIKKIMKWKEEDNLTNAQIKPLLIELRKMNPFEQGLMGDGDSTTIAVKADEMKAQTIAIGKAFADQLDAQFSTYLSQMQAMFTMNLEDQKNMIRGEIDRALQSLAERDSNLVSSLDEQSKSQREELRQKLTEIAEKAENQGIELQEKLSDMFAKDLEAKEAVANKQVEAMERQISNWATILKEDIEKLSYRNKRKKWYKPWA